MRDGFNDGANRADRGAVSTTNHQHTPVRQAVKIHAASFVPLNDFDAIASTGAPA
jgi:hypothetical protein